MIGLLMMLATVIGGSSYVITEGYQRAYDEMVWTDGGVVFPAPKAKPAAVPHGDEDPIKIIVRLR